MAFPGREAVLSQVSSLTIECTDCGRTRIRTPADLQRHGIDGAVRLSTISARLSCAACRAEGLPGRNISVQAAFLAQRDRISAEAYMLNRREALSRARRARGA